MNLDVTHIYNYFRRSLVMQAYKCQEIHHNIQHEPSPTI